MDVEMSKKTLADPLTSINLSNSAPQLYVPPKTLVTSPEIGLIT